MEKGVTTLIDGGDATTRRPLATALLMGCSSAKQQNLGLNDAFGIPNHYLIGGAPTVVGVLWDVLSGDIDRFTVRALAEWSTTGDLSRALESARSECRLMNLTGTAVVQYGIPWETDS